MESSCLERTSISKSYTLFVSFLFYAARYFRFKFEFLLLHDYRLSLQSTIQLVKHTVVSNSEEGVENNMLYQRRQIVLEKLNKISRTYPNFK